jgi:hypothetical protein
MSERAAVKSEAGAVEACEDGVEGAGAACCASVTAVRATANAATQEHREIEKARIIIY